MRGYLLTVHTQEQRTHRVFPPFSAARKQWELALKRDKRTDTQALLRDDVLYSSFHPMNFLGNHDTPRVASRLTHAEHKHLALTFLFACRGIPALYYGDELGLKGDKGEADAGWGGDAGMRQAMPPPPDELKLIGGAAGGGMEAEARRTLRLTRELARMHAEVEVLRIGSQEGHFVVRARAPRAPSPLLAWRNAWR